MTMSETPAARRVASAEEPAGAPWPKGHPDPPGGPAGGRRARPNCRPWLLPAHSPPPTQSESHH